jgi:CRISPR-associated protein Cmr2
MKKYLQFTIGPVQSFVAQAKRTRDYWSGSFLLSCLTGKAMLAIIENNGSIVFPAVQDENLQDENSGITDPLLKAIKLGQKYPHVGSLPNRFLAEVSDTFRPEACVDAVNQAWQQIADEVWQTYVAPVAEKLGNGSYEIWQRQIYGFWEMSWVMGKQSDLLDRRKNWRNHIAPEEPGDKCTLMGNWQELSGYIRIAESKKQDKFWRALSERIPGYNLQPDERLCSIALIKRLFPLTLKGMDTSYPSTPYLAAIPWLTSVINDPQEQEKARNFAQAASDKLVRTSFTFDTGKLGKDLSKFVSLEGNCYFKSTLENDRLWEQWKTDEKVQASLNSLRNLLKDFKSQPSPFYALLLMDGDRIGELLNEDDQRPGISKAISNFSNSVEDIISQYKGITVYAGGDDVAALFPMDQALEAAQALQVRYQDSFAGLVLSRQPTISAAIVYAHHHAPLNQIIAKAHQVLDEEAKEKTGRSAIAVSVWKTGGEMISWSAPWQIKDSDNRVTPVCDLIKELTARLRQRQLSNSFIYGIRKVLGNSLGNSFVVPEGMDLAPLLVAQLMDNREIDTGRDQAEDIIRRLLNLCAQHYRDEEGTIVRNNSQFCLDAALFIKFLVTKGVIK